MQGFVNNQIDKCIFERQLNTFGFFATIPLLKQKEDSKSVVIKLTISIL